MAYYYAPSATSGQCYPELQVQMKVDIYTDGPNGGLNFSQAVSTAPAHLMGENWALSCNSQPAVQQPALDVSRMLPWPDKNSDEVRSDSKSDKSKKHHHKKRHAKHKDDSQNGSSMSLASKRSSRHSSSQKQKSTSNTGYPEPEKSPTCPENNSISPHFAELSSMEDFNNISKEDILPEEVLTDFSISNGSNTNVLDNLWTNTKLERPQTLPGAFPVYPSETLRQPKEIPPETFIIREQPVKPSFEVIPEDVLINTFEEETEASDRSRPLSHYELPVNKNDVSNKILQTSKENKPRKEDQVQENTVEPPCRTPPLSNMQLLPNEFSTRFPIPGARLIYETQETVTTTTVEVEEHVTREVSPRVASKSRPEPAPRQTKVSFNNNRKVVQLSPSLSPTSFIQNEGSKETLINDIPTQNLQELPDALTDQVKHIPIIIHPKVHPVRSNTTENDRATVEQSEPIQLKKVFSTKSKETLIDDIPNTALDQTLESPIHELDWNIQNGSFRHIPSPEPPAERTIRAVAVSSPTVELHPQKITPHPDMKSQNLSAASSNKMVNDVIGKNINGIPNIYAKPAASISSSSTAVSSLQNKGILLAASPENVCQDISSDSANSTVTPLDHNVDENYFPVYENLPIRQQCDRDLALQKQLMTSEKIYELYTKHPKVTAKSPQPSPMSVEKQPSSVSSSSTSTAKAYDSIDDARSSISGIVYPELQAMRLENSKYKLPEERLSNYDQDGLMHVASVGTRDSLVASSMASKDSVLSETSMRADHRQEISDSPVGHLKNSKVLTAMTKLIPISSPEVSTGHSITSETSSISQIVKHQPDILSQSTMLTEDDMLQNYLQDRLTPLGNDFAFSYADSVASHDSVVSEASLKADQSLDLYDHHHLNSSPPSSTASNSKPTIKPNADGPGTKTFQEIMRNSAIYSVGHRSSLVRDKPAVTGTIGSSTSISSFASVHQDMARHAPVIQRPPMDSSSGGLYGLAKIGMAQIGPDGEHCSNPLTERFQPPNNSKKVKTSPGTPTAL